MERAKTRKPHKKSRNGCLPCKGRHVKCDETKPQCVNCVKQGMKCEYRPLKSREGSAGSPLPVTATTPVYTEDRGPEQASPMAPTPSAITLNIPQLRLLHHYSTITGPSLGADSEAGAVWASSVVHTAFDFPYLLHVVLALAALHMGRLEEPSGPKALEYMLLAGQHYEAALSVFQSTVRDINESNYRPVLMFAALLFPYSCTASVNAEHDVEHAMDSLLSNFALTRRVRPMVAGFYEAMKASDMGKMIPKDVDGIDWTTEEPPVETELVQLRKFSEVVHHLYPPDIVDAYGYAIHVLELTFAASAKFETPASDALLKIWIHFVSDRYVELLSERQPGSLIIYAHYAVLLHRSSGQYWYLKGVAEQILHVAYSLVPTEWKSWLDWPKEQIHGAHNLAMPG